jgi:hypothetical protein
VILFAPSSLGEVWLTAINAHVYCGVIALVLLCEDTRAAGRKRIAFQAALLGFCGLSGVYAVSLAFAFAAKVWLERSRGARAFLAVIAASAAVQVGVFVWLWTQTNLRASRFEQLDWVRSLTNAFYQQFVVPLGLRPVLRIVGDPAEVLGWLANEPRAPVLVALALAGALLAIGVVAFLADRDLRSPRNLLVIAVPSLVSVTAVAAKHGRLSGRYAVVPGIALLFLLLAHARFEPGAPRWRPLAAAALLGWALLVGAAGYRDDDAFRCPGGCPRWRDELARWCAEPSYAPQVWPVRVPESGPQWRVRLPPSLTSRACPATRRDRPAAAR